MVKKSSLLNKIVGRWRASSGVRMEEAEELAGRARGAARKPEVAARRLGAQGPAAGEEHEPRLPSAGVNERVSGRKLSAKEEAMLTVEGGLKELTNQLRALQTRMDADGSRTSQLASDMQQLPALGKAQLDLLATMNDQLQRQSRVGESLLQAMADLPQAMGELRASMEKVAATDARTASTLDEFRTTMDSIQGAMRDMVGVSKNQDHRAERLAESLADVVKSEKAKTDRLASTLDDVARGQQSQTEKLAKSMESAVSFAVQGATRDTKVLQEMVKGIGDEQQQAVAALRRAHEDQSVRIGKMVENAGRWNKGVLAMLVVLSVLGAAILAALLTR